jgi:hypothetical protein
VILEPPPAADTPAEDLPEAGAPDLEVRPELADSLAAIFAEAHDEPALPERRPPHEPQAVPVPVHVPVPGREPIDVPVPAPVPVPGREPTALLAPSPSAVPEPSVESPDAADLSQPVRLKPPLFGHRRLIIGVAGAAVIAVSAVAIVRPRPATPPTQVAATPAPVTSLSLSAAPPLPLPVAVAPSRGERARPVPAAHVATSPPAPAVKDPPRTTPPAPTPPAPRFAHAAPPARVAQATQRPGRAANQRRIAALKRAGSRGSDNGQSAHATVDGRSHARTAYHDGNRRLFQGDTAGAIRAYEEALRDDPGYAAGYRGLGIAYEQQGNGAEALMAFHSYLKAAPQARDAELIRRRVRNLEGRDEP